MAVQKQATDEGSGVPQLAMAVWATYGNFRKLVAYVLTSDATQAVQTVKQLGYLGLNWEVELVTLPPVK
jgi:hypothetical protein